jgi:MYXO-CTERM domain-containing protein
MRTMSRLSAAAALVLATGAAHAGYSYQVVVTAQSSLGTSSVTFTGNDAGLRFGTVDTTPLGSTIGQEAQGWAWNQNSSTVLNSGNGAIASIGRTAASFIDDPVVLLSFNVQAGAADTLFTVTSLIVTTDPLQPYTLTAAAAAVTGTDGGAGNGVTLTGAFPGAKLFAYRNNGLNTGFLLNGGTSGGFVPYTENALFSDPAFITGIGTISSAFSFTLSAGDTASGTSVYRIDVPAPASAALLGFAGLAAARRRRR